MASQLSHLFLLVYLLSLSYLTRAVASPRPDTPTALLRNSCTHARYPSLCIHTLSSFAHSAKTPNDLAQAAVSLSLSRALNLSSFLSSLLRARHLGKREHAALQDCAEELSDSVDEVRSTLSELRHLRAATFRWQMSNAETWVSAALTNEDSCLDGFQIVPGRSKVAVRRKIRNVARVTSNALYLINLVADTRGMTP